MSIRRNASIHVEHNFSQRAYALRPYDRFKQRCSLRRGPLPFWPEFSYSTQNYYQGEGDIAAPMDSRQNSPTRFQVLTPDEAETLELIAERIFPKTNTPGAVEIGAVNYIDIALAGDYAPLAPLYRQGIRAVHRYARSKFGRAFRSLSDELQDAVLVAFEAGAVGEFKNAAEFFETVALPRAGRNFLRAAVWRQQGYDRLAHRRFPWPAVRLCGRLREQARGSGAGGCGLQQERREKIMTASIADVCIVGRRWHGRHHGQRACVRRVEGRGLRARAGAEAGRLRAARFDSISHTARATRLGAPRTDDGEKQGGRANAGAISHQPAQRFGRRAAPLDRTIVALHAGRFQTFYQRDRERQRRARRSRSFGLRYYRLAAQLTTISSLTMSASNGNSASRERPAPTRLPARASAAFRCRRCAIRPR